MTENLLTALLTVTVFEAKIISFNLIICMLD